MFKEHRHVVDWFCGAVCSCSDGAASLSRDLIFVVISTLISRLLGLFGCTRAAHRSCVGQRCRLVSVSLVFGLYILIQLWLDPDLRIM